MNPIRHPFRQNVAVAENETLELGPRGLAPPMLIAEPARALAAANLLDKCRDTAHTLRWARVDCSELLLAVR
jgi:hypothetical protein